MIHLLSIVVRYNNTIYISMAIKVFLMVKMENYGILIA